MAGRKKTNKPAATAAPVTKAPARPKKDEGDVPRFTPCKRLGLTMSPSLVSNHLRREYPGKKSADGMKIIAVSLEATMESFLGDCYEYMREHGYKSLSHEVIAQVAGKDIVWKTIFGGIPIPGASDVGRDVPDYRLLEEMMVH